MLMQVQCSWLLLTRLFSPVYNIFWILQKLYVGENLLGEEEISSEGMKSLTYSVNNYLKRNLNF